jgi:hypothetical protein
MIISGIYSFQRQQHQLVSMDSSLRQPWRPGRCRGSHEHGFALEDLRRQENPVDLVHRHRSCRVHGAADLRVRPRRPHPDGADVVGEVEPVPRSGEGGHRVAPPQAADLSQGVEPGERVVQEQDVSWVLVSLAMAGVVVVFFFFFGAANAESLGTKMVMPALVSSAWLWKVSMTLVLCR